MKKPFKNFFLIRLCFITLLLLSVGLYGMAQIAVTGTVKDNGGELLPGVTIVVQGFNYWYCNKY